MIKKLSINFDFKNIFHEIKNETSCNIFMKMVLEAKKDRSLTVSLPAVINENFLIDINATPVTPISIQTLESMENLAVPKYKLHFKEGTSSFSFKAAIPVTFRKIPESLTGQQSRVYTVFYNLSFLNEFTYCKDASTDITVTAAFNRSFTGNLRWGRPKTVIGGKNRDEEKGISYPVKEKFSRGFLSAKMKTSFALPDMISINIGRKHLF